MRKERRVPAASNKGFVTALVIVPSRKTCLVSESTRFKSSPRSTPQSSSKTKKADALLSAESTHEKSSSRDSASFPLKIVFGIESESSLGNRFRVLKS
jgi:hypothetical protein